MHGGVSTSFILFIWILTVTLSPGVRGQVRVVGTSVAVKGHVGDVVVLPCRSDPPEDLVPLTVEWTRAELRPHPSDRLKRVPFVHVYNDHRDDDPDMKIPEFTNRTQLFPDQLGAGVASLRIQNLTLSDNGTYKCFIPNLPTNRTLRWTYVTLVVESAVTIAPTQAPHLKPRQKDSGPADDSNTPTDRTNGVKIDFSTMMLVFGMALLVCMFPTVQQTPPRPQTSTPDKSTQDRLSTLTLPLAEIKDDSTQQMLMNGCGDSAVVCVDDVTVLISP